MSGDGPSPAGAHSRVVAIANKRGLHARAAAKFVRMAGAYDAKVTVSFGGQSVSGLSIMGLMMLAAGIGSSIEIATEGRDGREALSALCALVEGKFGEE